MFDLLLSPNAWLALLTLDRARDRARHRQHHFPVAGGEQACPCHAARRHAASDCCLRSACASFCCRALRGSFRFRSRSITMLGVDLSWHDIVFGAGGLFLLTKSTREIHGMVEGEEHESARQGRHNALRHHPDRDLRYRVLDRFRGDRGRHGGASVDHDRRRRAGDGGDAVRVWPGRGISSRSIRP